MTGASRGIGRGVAVSLARAGARVALVGRDAAALDETLREIKTAGGHALPLQADVTNADSVEAAVALMPAQSPGAAAGHEPDTLWRNTES